MTETTNRRLKQQKLAEKVKSMRTDLKHDEEFRSSTLGKTIKSAKIKTTQIKQFVLDNIWPPPISVIVVFIVIPVIAILLKKITA